MSPSMARTRAGGSSPLPEKSQPLFGGQRFDGLSSDLWFYSVRDNQWTEVAMDSASVPPARVGGIAFLRETSAAYELYLNGGATSDGGQSAFLDDLWKLSWAKP
jgi:hypothetical protein